MANETTTEKRRTEERRANETRTEERRNDERRAEEERFCILATEIRCSPPNPIFLQSAGWV